MPVGARSVTSRADAGPDTVAAAAAAAAAGEMQAAGTLDNVAAAAAVSLAPGLCGQRQTG